MIMNLRPALEDAIRTLRAGNPFLPVKVVVPNHLLGVWLSRSIFKDTGHMAIEFVLVHELAWKVAAPSLLREGRARVPENVGLAVLLGAIPEAVTHQSTPDYLREAVKTAGFAPAALRTIEDLAGANLRPDHLERAAPTAADPERLRLVARLWRAFEAGLEKAPVKRRTCPLPPRVDLTCMLPIPQRSAWLQEDCNSWNSSVLPEAPAVRWRP